MEKSDNRIKHTSEEYKELAFDLKKIIKIILLQLRTQVREKKDIMFLYSLARGIVQTESIIDLWTKKHYSDCMVLYRTQVERLLTLHYLVDSETIQEYDDWSFIQNYEARNKAKSDQEHAAFLNKGFWVENEKRIEKYQRLKKLKITWKRPNPTKLEEIAKSHDLLFLFKYGYRHASGYVHPLSSDGEDEFEIVTGIPPKNKRDYDTTPILNNSIVVLYLMLQLALQEMNFKWHEEVFKTMNLIEDYIRNHVDDYKKHLNIIEEMFEVNFKIYEPNAT